MKLAGLYSDRFSVDTVKQGVEAQDLLDNPIFFEAVKNVLNKYAEHEEELLTDVQSTDVREINAKVRAYAQLRRATLDIVQELSNMMSKGQRHKSAKNRKDGIY